MRPHGLYNKLPLVSACVPHTSFASDSATNYIHIKIENNDIERDNFIMKVRSIVITEE